jgi:multisubunit Na+/H+ antiporter MnhG subunit
VVADPARCQISLGGYVYSMLSSGAISWRAVIAAATMLYLGSTASIALASAHVRAGIDDAGRGDNTARVLDDAALLLGSLGICLTLVRCRR